MRKLSALFTIILLSLNFIYAQQITAKLIDGSENKPLPGANTILYFLPDSSKWSGTTSDLNGIISFNNQKPGNYLLRITYIGFEKIERRITLGNEPLKLGRIKMKPIAKTLGAVNIEAAQIKVEQSGDTTSYRAAGYKTNPDANAEDLVQKMPGITVESGNVKAQGEDVKKVTVDGKDFFGDDPSLALKNLPADVIDRVQIFDQMSDQAQFTGFDDGNTSKTMNISTRFGKLKATFGKVYAGYGTDDRYNAGGTLNFFSGERRITLNALFNNVNQQNFQTQDLMGVLGNAVRRGGGMPRGGAEAISRMTRGGGGSDFMVGQQNGITKTNAVGLNYTDMWGKKISVNGSYFFNYSENENQTNLIRSYFTKDTIPQLYNESSSSSSKNYNHRINLRMEYTIDSSNSIILAPRLSFQDYSSSSFTNGNNTIGGNSISKTNNQSASSYNGLNFNNNILYRHKFNKPGRTFSINLNTEINTKDGNSSQLSANTFLKGISDSTWTLDQQGEINNKSTKISGSINYTEPITESLNLQVSYNPSYTKSNSDKTTFNLDTITHNYSFLDTLLSNSYENEYITQRGGISLRYKVKQGNFTIGANYQYAELDGFQTYPYKTDVNHSFKNILPNAMAQIRFANKSNLRFFYRTSTNAPSVTQLQDVVDNSNPLFLSAGNPNLKQDYSHTLTMRFNKTNTEKGRSIFLFLYAGITQNYIGNETFIARRDTVINGSTLFRGSQFSRPVNLDGFKSIRSFLTYGLPVKFIKSNLNLNLGYNYTRTPSLNNGSSSYSNNSTITSGFVLSSNISERLDFTLSYTGNYTFSNSTLQSSSDSRYYNQITGFKINWMPMKKLVINSDISHSYYHGLSEGYDDKFFLWNAYIGYKFLKNNAGELKVSVYDLLNQNKSLSRSITDTYIEDNRSMVLRRYVMFTFTYTIRKIGFTPNGNNPSGNTPSAPNGEQRPRRHE